MKSPKVTLVSSTPLPIELMCYFRRIMHAPVPDSLLELIHDPEKWLGMSVDDYVEKVLRNDNMPTFLEAPSFVFKIEHVSRALTHQMVRHRVGFSYSQQSMRCVSVEDFADDGNYVCPSTVQFKGDYHNLMLEIQGAYRTAVGSGMSTQDARNLLPMGIQTSIIVSCNLRALIGMINKRLCFKTQEEFNEVAMHMRDQVLDVDERLGKWINSPCGFGKCMMQSENLQQFKEGKLEGKQNTDHVCPIWMRKFSEGCK